MGSVKYKFKFVNFLLSLTHHKFSTVQQTQCY